MPVYLRVRLTESEKRELIEIRNLSNTSLRTRIRIEILTLSDIGLSVRQIASNLKKNETMIRRTIRRWIDRGKEGLIDKPRRGRPKKWKDEDIEYLENCLEREERTYNSQQLSQKLLEEKQVELSPQRIRKILKKKTGDGKERKQV